MPPKAKQEEFRKSLETFTQAVDIGNKNLEKHADDFESGDNPNIQMISVADARTLGIMPIASGEPSR
jgi:hypothetical protein